MADASCRIVRASLKTAQFREGSVPERITTCTITLPPERRGRWQAYGCRVITCASDFCNNNANTEHDAAVEVLPLFHGGSSTQQRSWGRRGGWGAPEKHQNSPKKLYHRHSISPPPPPLSTTPWPQIQRRARQRRAGVWWPATGMAAAGEPAGPSGRKLLFLGEGPRPQTSCGTARPRSPPRRSAPSSRESAFPLVCSPLRSLPPGRPPRALAAANLDLTAAVNLGWPR